MEHPESAATQPNPEVSPNPFGAKHWRARATEDPVVAPERNPRDLSNPYVWMAVAVLGGAAVGTLLGLLH